MSSTEETVTLRRSARKSVIAKSQDEAPSTPRKTRGTTPLKTSVEAVASPGGTRKPRGTTPTKKSLIAVEKVSTPKKNLPTVKEETPRIKTVSSVKEDRSTPKKKSPLPKRSVASVKEDRSTPKKSPPSKKSLSSVKEDKSTPKKKTPPSKKSVSSLNEDESTPRKRRAAATTSKMTSVGDQKKQKESSPKKNDKETENEPKVDGVSLEGGRLARGNRKSVAVTVPKKEITVASSRSQSDSSPETVHPRGRPRKSVRFVGASQTSSSGEEETAEEKSQTEDSGKKEMKKSKVDDNPSSKSSELSPKSCHVNLERLSLESLEELESGSNSYLATFPKSNENPPRHEIIEAVKAEVVEENVSETALVPSDGKLENARHWYQGTKSDKVNDVEGEGTSQDGNYEAIPGEGKESTAVFDNCLLSPNDFLNSEDEGTDEISEDRGEHLETMQEDEICPLLNQTKSPRRKLSFTKPVSEPSNLQITTNQCLTSKIEGNDEHNKSREGKLSISNKEHEFQSSMEDELPENNGKKSEVIDNHSRENRTETSHNVPSCVTLPIGSSSSDSNSSEKVMIDNLTEESKDRNILKGRDITCEGTAEADDNSSMSNDGSSSEGLPVKKCEDLQLNKKSNDKQEDLAEEKSDNSVENTLTSPLVHKKAISSKEDSGSKYFKQFETWLVEKDAECGAEQTAPSPKTGILGCGEMECNVLEEGETKVESLNEKNVLENKEKQEHFQKSPGGNKESLGKVCGKEKQLRRALELEHLEDVRIENSPGKIQENSCFNEKPQINCVEPQKTISVGHAKEITGEIEVIANSPKKLVKDSFSDENVAESCVIKSSNKQRNETTSIEKLFEKIKTVKSPMSPQVETKEDNEEMLDLETSTKHKNDSIYTEGIVEDRHNSFIAVEKNSQSDIEKTSVIESSKEYVANKNIEDDEEHTSTVKSPTKRKRESISFEAICKEHQTYKSPLKKQVEIPEDTSAVKSPKKHKQESLSETIAEEQKSIDENTENDLDGTFIIESPQKHEKESVSNEIITKELVNKTSKEQAISVEESEGDVEEISSEKSPKKLRKKCISEEVENIKSPKKHTPSSGFSEEDVQEVCTVHSPKKSRKKSVSFFVDITEESETIKCTKEQHILSVENMEGDIKDNSVETPNKGRKKSVPNEKVTEELTSTKSPLKIQKNSDSVAKSPKKRRLENLSEIIAEDQVSIDENTENDLEGTFLVESPEEHKNNVLKELESTESPKQKTIFIEDSDVEEICIEKSPKIRRKKSVSSNETITEILSTTISPKIKINNTEKNKLDIEEECILKSPKKNKRKSISVEQIAEEFQTNNSPVQRTVAIEDSDGDVNIIFIEKSPKKPRKKSISAEEFDPKTTFPKEQAVSIEDSDVDVEVIPIVNSTKKHRKQSICNDVIAKLETAKSTKEQQILSPKEVIEEPCVVMSPKKGKKMSISDEGIPKKLEVKKPSKNYTPSDEDSEGNVEEIHIQKSKILGKRSFSDEDIVEVLATPKSPKKPTFSSELSLGDVEEICIESPKKHRKRIISNEEITEKLVTTISPIIQIKSAAKSGVDIGEECILKSPKKHKKKSISEEGSTEEVGTKSSEEQFSSPESAEGVIEGISVRESPKQHREKDVSNEGNSEEFATSESPNEQISSNEETSDGKSPRKRRKSKPKQHREKDVSSEGITEEFATSESPNEQISSIEDGDNEETNDGKSPRKRRKDSSTEESSTETSKKFYSIRKYFLDLEAKEKGVMVDDSEALETESGTSGSDSSESSAQSARNFLDLEAVEDNEYDTGSDSLSASTSDESVDELVKKETEDAIDNTEDEKTFVSRDVIIPRRSIEKDHTESVKLYSQFLRNLRRSSEYKLKNKFKVSKLTKAKLEKNMLKSQRKSFQTNAGKFTVELFKDNLWIESRVQQPTNVHNCFTVTLDKNLIVAKQNKNNKEMNVKNTNVKLTSKKNSKNLPKKSEQCKTEEPPVKKRSTGGQPETKGTFIGTVLLDCSIEMSSLRKALKVAGVTGVKDITLVNNDTTAFIEFSCQEALQEALHKSADLKLKLNNSFFFILMPGNNQ